MCVDSGSYMYNGLHVVICMFRCLFVIMSPMISGLHGN